MCTRARCVVYVYVCACNVSNYKHLGLVVDTKCLCACVRFRATVSNKGSRDGFEPSGKFGKVDGAAIDRA